MYRYYFEKLTVWQDAKDLVVLIYKMSQGFPKQEMYGLASQLQRAAVSVTANIAEGSSRNTPKDQANFSTNKRMWNRGIVESLRLWNRIIVESSNREECLIKN